MSLPATLCLVTLPLVTRCLLYTRCRHTGVPRLSDYGLKTPHPHLAFLHVLGSDGGVSGRLVLAPPPLAAWGPRLHPPSHPSFSVLLCEELRPNAVQWNRQMLTGRARGRRGFVCALNVKRCSVRPRWRGGDRARGAFARCFGSVLWLGAFARVLNRERLR